MSEKRAEEIWAEAVKETGIWLSPFAEQFAEFARLIIPRYRAALDAERMTCAIAKTELGEFVEWLTQYAEKPLDRELIRQAERKDLSVKTLLSLGHGAALSAVTGKVKEILQRRFP